MKVSNYGMFFVWMVITMVFSIPFFGSIYFISRFNDNQVNVNGGYVLSEAKVVQLYESSEQLKMIVNVRNDLVSLIDTIDYSSDIFLRKKNKGEKINVLVKNTEPYDMKEWNYFFYNRFYVCVLFLILGVLMIIRRDKVYDFMKDWEVEADGY